MLKMSSIGINSLTVTFASFINRVVDDVLSHAIPDIDQTLLQFIDVIRCRLVHLLLHFSQNFSQSDLDCQCSCLTKLM